MTGKLVRATMQKEAPVIGLKFNSLKEKSSLEKKLVTAEKKKGESNEVILIETNGDKLATAGNKKGNCKIKSILISHFFKEPVSNIDQSMIEEIDGNIPNVDMGESNKVTGLDNEAAVAETTKLDEEKLDAIPSKSPQRSELEDWTIVEENAGNSSAAGLHSAATSIDLAEEEVALLHPGNLTPMHPSSKEKKTGKL